jgi:hypothetical protein
MINFDPLKSVTGTYMECEHSLSENNLGYGIHCFFTIIFLLSNRFPSIAYMSKINIPITMDKQLRIQNDRIQFQLITGNYQRPSDINPIKVKNSMNRQNFQQRDYK